MRITMILTLLLLLFPIGVGPANASACGFDQITTSDIRPHKRLKGTVHYRWCVKRARVLVQPRSIKWCVHRAINRPTGVNAFIRSGTKVINPPQIYVRNHSCRTQRVFRKSWMLVPLARIMVYTDGRRWNQGVYFQ